MKRYLDDIPSKSYDHLWSRPMTNAEKIRSMSNKELRDFLDKFRVETHTEPFGKKFCKCCPTVGTTEYKECEFVDGVCPHGDSLTWWLEQKVVT